MGGKHTCPRCPAKTRGCRARIGTGAKVADIGCGTSVALIEMAKAFARSKIHGYELSKCALARARKNLSMARKNLKQGQKRLKVTFREQSGDTLPADASFDLITTIDCVHDMTNPEGLMRAVRKALKPNRTWLIVVAKGKATFVENLERNPRAGILYSLSVLVCMSSGLSEPNGAGLGTLGFTEAVARDMKRTAGFTRFTRHDFDDDCHAYYELRP